MGDGRLSGAVSHFAFLPILGVAVLVGLARRREVAPMRVLCLAIAIDYLVSLPWFLLFPVPRALGASGVQRDAALGFVLVATHRCHPAD